MMMIVVVVMMMMPPAPLRTQNSAAVQNEAWPKAWP